MDKPSDPAAPPSASFARFVSSVKGHLVSRYGSATAKRAPALIGATRSVKALQNGPMGLERTEAEITWDEERVVALTEREARLFRREYDEAVKTGALKERTAKDYDAWIAAQTKRDADAVAAAKAKQEADAKAAADAKAKAEAEAKRAAAPATDSPSPR